jgi:hypothetical protein
MRSRSRLSTRQGIPARPRSAESVESVTWVMSQPDAAHAKSYECHALDRARGYWRGATYTLELGTVFDEQVEHIARRLAAPINLQT